MPICPPVRPVDVPETILCRACMRWLEPAAYYVNKYRAPWTRGHYSTLCRCCTKAERREQYHADPQAANRATVRRRRARRTRDPSATAQAVLGRMQRLNTLPVTFARQRMKRAHPKPRPSWPELLLQRKMDAIRRREDRRLRQINDAKAIAAERQRRAEELHVREEANGRARAARVLDGRDPVHMSPGELQDVLRALMASE